MLTSQWSSPGRRGGGGLTARTGTGAPAPASRAAPGQSIGRRRSITIAAPKGNHVKSSDQMGLHVQSIAGRRLGGCFEGKKERRKKRGREGRGGGARRRVGAHDGLDGCQHCHNLDLPGSSCLRGREATGSQLASCIIPTTCRSHEQVA